MSKLAIHGGKPALDGEIAKFNSIGDKEQTAALIACHDTLSGFLGGETDGGPHVRSLETLWAETFKTKYAISVNSATSGLLAAAAAIGLKPGDEFIVSPYTMSATVAAPMMLGATPVFVDIEPDTYNLDVERVTESITRKTKAVIVTNLFGHPAHLRELRKHCDELGIWLIEDNAQSPFAEDHGQYAGTVGHIGVFSLNVHKHLQCGEGGICVTRDTELARRLFEYRNHGEMASGTLGLNLRMTEITAAIAIEQLRKAFMIIRGRINQAHSLSSIVRSIGWMSPPIARHGCSAVYYHWVFEADYARIGVSRDQLALVLRAENFPVQTGYVEPLYSLKAFQPYATGCPVAEEKYWHRVLYFENCGYTLTPRQIEQVGDAFRKVEANIHTISKQGVFS